MKSAWNPARKCPESGPDSVHSGAGLIVSAAERIVMGTPSLDAEILMLLEEQAAFHHEQLERASPLLERARAAVAIRGALRLALFTTRTPSPADGRSSAATGPAGT